MHLCRLKLLKTNWLSGLALSLAILQPIQGLAAVSCPQSPAEVSELSKNLGDLVQEIQKSPQCEGVVGKIQDIEKRLNESNIGSLLKNATSAIKLPSGQKNADDLPAAPTSILTTAKTAMYQLSPDQFEKLKGDVAGIVGQTFQLVTMATQGKECAVSNTKLQKMLYTHVSDIIQNLTRVSSTFVGPYGVPLEVGGSVISSILLMMGRGFSTAAFDMNKEEDRRFFTKNLCAYSEFYRRSDLLMDNQEEQVKLQEVIEQSVAFAKELESRNCVAIASRSDCFKLRSEILSVVKNRKSEESKLAWAQLLDKHSQRFTEDLLTTMHENYVTIEVLKESMVEHKPESLGPEWAELVVSQEPIDKLYYQVWSPRYLRWLADYTYSHSSANLLRLISLFSRAEEGESCAPKKSGLPGIPEVVVCISARKVDPGGRLSSDETMIIKEAKKMALLTDLYDHYCNFFEETKVKVQDLKGICQEHAGMNIVRQLVAQARADLYRPRRDSVTSTAAKESDEDADAEDDENETSDGRPRFSQKLNDAPTTNRSVSEKRAFWRNLFLKNQAGTRGAGR